MSIATLSCHFEPKLFKAHSIFAHSFPYLPSRGLSLRTTIRTHAKYKIKLVKPDGTKHEFYARDDTYILEAANKAGVPLPVICGTGSCSACTAKLQSGKVDQSEGSFLEDHEKKQGYILTCISYPRSNCVIHTHKEDDLFKKEK